jgi:hypothetical protein
MLTQERLKELLHYDAETGVFTRIATAGGRGKIGDIAGTITNKGYLHITIDSKLHLGHRLSFLYMTGAFPKDFTDHIDGDKLNNRWTNLRECTHAENHQNRVSNKGSSSKYPGVSWHKRDQKWQARITINGKEKHLGYFDTEEAAHAAYCKAKAEHHTFNPTPRDFA